MQRRFCRNQLSQYILLSILSFSRKQLLFQLVNYVIYDLSYHFVKCGCSLIISHLPLIKLSPRNEMNEIMHQINVYDNQVSAFILCIFYRVRMLESSCTYLWIYTFHVFSNMFSYLYIHVYRRCNLCFASNNKE